jgi:hypothetical protein
MKSRILFVVLNFLLMLHPGKSQSNPPGISNTKNESQPADTLEQLAFQRLVSYISMKGEGITATEGLNDSLKHFGEEHRLVAPILTFPGTESAMAGRFSYDNFLPSVYNKDPLHGSPFLLSNYVPGLVINQLDSVLNKPDYLYNYDKMSGNFLLKRTNEQPIAVNKNQVKYFCLKLEDGGYIFERVNLINPEEFYQVMYKGPKYSYYKLYKSKFIPASKHTNGYLSEGNNYDEYRDIITYYLVDQKKEEAVVFELTKKSIRKSLASESVAVEQYLKDHKYDELSESYMVHLLEKLNK